LQREFSIVAETAMISRLSEKSLIAPRSKRGYLAAMIYQLTLTSPMPLQTAAFRSRSDQRLSFF
jgi:hypothetical protein